MVTSRQPQPQLEADCWRRELDWIGWRGRTATRDDVVDVAWQAAATASPIVVHTAGFVDYQILEPRLISCSEIHAVDLVTGRPFSLMRSMASTSGWYAVQTAWDRRN